MERKRLYYSVSVSIVIWLRNTDTHKWGQRNVMGLGYFN